jgi:hypothetical protein
VNIHNKAAETAANNATAVCNPALFVKRPAAFSTPAKNAINTNIGDKKAITTLKVTEGPAAAPIFP